MFMFKSGLCQLAASVTHDNLISFAFSQYRCQHLITLTFSCATKYMYLECVCVYSNSRNDVPRVAQRAHTRRRASVLVVSVVFCMHMYSFAGLIRRTPPPTFSDTAITDRHSDTTIFQLRAHWVRISWSIGSEKSFGHVPPVGVELSTSCVQGEHPIPLGQALRYMYLDSSLTHFILVDCSTVIYVGQVHLLF